MITGFHHSTTSKVTDDALIYRIAIDAFVAQVCAHMIIDVALVMCELTPIFRQVAVRIKMTGEMVAERSFGSDSCGTPMTYQLDGKQYIVVAAVSDGVAEIIALSLP